MVKIVIWSHASHSISFHAIGNMIYDCHQLRQRSKKICRENQKAAEKDRERPSHKKRKKARDRKRAKQTEFWRKTQRTHILTICICYVFVLRILRHCFITRINVDVLSTYVLVRDLYRKKWIVYTKTNSMECFNNSKPYAIPSKFRVKLKVCADHSAKIFHNGFHWNRLIFNSFPKSSSIFLFYA